MATKKYVSRTDKDLVIDIEQVKKDTTIDTVNGPALITKGNYIITFEDKSQAGITKVDLDLFYKPAK
jgi:hypothetical protein